MLPRESARETERESERERERVGTRKYRKVGNAHRSRDLCPRSKTATSDGRAIQRRLTGEIRNRSGRFVQVA